MFNDLDLAQSVKIICNEDEEHMDLMAIKAIPTDSDVFLIDHAWTFRYQDAYETLQKNPTLLKRLDELSEYGIKQELPDGKAKTAASEETKDE